MNVRDRVLYHQIHPLKVATDVGTGLAALFFFRQHRLRNGLAVVLIPPAAVSFALIRWADLEPYRRSRAGRYIRRRMTGWAQALRLVGYGLMALGAWLRRPPFVALGLAGILFGWFHGVILPRR